ncbi:MAG: radical SAM protein, partial [Candidatus Omnitrophota bacterium]|nr:radical SAM protein [Candidatus Omnitrophota bacterium]
MYIPVLNKIFRSIQKRHPGALLYYPSKISIETGNICNLSCPLCPTADGSREDVEKGLLSFEDFKVIFEKIRPFVKTLDLFSWGEPFLNKDIGRMIRYARERKPALRMFIDTNLNTISEDQIDTVVRYGLDVLKVSCDGVSQEVYVKYRVGGDIARVLENVGKLLEKKKELCLERPRIIWKYLVFRHNQGEVEQARVMARDMGIDFEASGMRTDCGKEIFEKIEDSVERDREWIPDQPEYNNYRDLSSGKAFCEKPWRTMTINWNGDVVPCGAIYDCSRYSFGNLLSRDFGDVWNGEKFVEARRIICARAGEDPDNICSICKENGYQFF